MVPVSLQFCFLGFSEFFFFLVCCLVKVEHFTNGFPSLKVWLVTGFLKHILMGVDKRRKWCKLSKIDNKRAENGRNGFNWIYQTVFFLYQHIIWASISIRVTKMRKLSKCRKFSHVIWPMQGQKRHTLLLLGITNTFIKKKLKRSKYMGIDQH